MSNRGTTGTGTLKNDPDAIVAGLPRQEYMKLAAKARRNALEELQRRHRKEFNKLLDEARVELGLDPRNPNRAIPRKW